MNLLFKVLIYVMFVLILIVNNVNGQFGDECMSECTCMNLTILCYASTLTSNISVPSPVFTNLDSSKLNRSFSRLSFNGYKLIPSSSFAKVQFSLDQISTDTNRSRVSIQFDNPIKVSKNAFYPLGNLQNGASKPYDLDVNFMTPVNFTLENYALNGTTFNKVEIYDIKSSEPLTFNLRGLSGATLINSLIIRTCLTIEKFGNEENIDEPVKANIKNIIISSSNITSFNNLTVDYRIISFESIESLEITYNPIEELGTHSFYLMNNLKRLSLSGNNLRDVGEFMLIQNKSNLIELDLSSNKIGYIHVYAFRTLISLKVLNLRYNQLKTLSLDLFRTLSNTLTTLDLSSSRNLTSFDWESLSFNKELKTLEASYLNNKMMLLNNDNSNDLLPFNLILTRLDTIRLFGYNFTHSDICKINFKQLLNKDRNMSLFQIDSGHVCNCFVIDIYNLYRLSHPVSGSDSSSGKWLSYTPYCYKRYYNLSLAQPINDDLLVYENICLLNREDICVKQMNETDVTRTTPIVTNSTAPTSTTTTTTTTTTTITTTTTTLVTTISTTAVTTTMTSITNGLDATKKNESDLSHTNILIISFSAVLIVILIIAFLISYKIRTNYKLKKYEYESFNDNTRRMEERF